MAESSAEARRSSSVVDSLPNGSAHRSAEEKIDAQVPGHRILRQLGRGGMASVYLAIQESMEREVALKIMLPSLAAMDPSFSERFVREAKIVANLSHPHINAVYDIGVTGPYHYFSMEYIAGGDLKSRIRKGLVPKAALAIARQIASALACAHAKGYVHRDVKPENVLFRENGMAVLTDFGIAKTVKLEIDVTTTGTVMGTPHYMSPEQATGRPTDSRADLYSLGIILFEMLTGKTPYIGDSAVSIALKHVTEPIPQLAPSLRFYQPLLEKFLAKAPADRFQTGEAAITAIDAFANGVDPFEEGMMNKPTGTDPTIVLNRDSAAARSEMAGRGSLRSRPRDVVFAAMLILLLIAGVGYVAWHKLDVSLPTVAAPVPAVQPAPVAVQTEAAARAVKISQLLAQADNAARAGQYFEPVDTAAVPTYRRVLQLEPDDVRATRALNEIAGRFITQAERAIEKNQLDQAGMFLKKAEDADSTHPMLFSRRLALSEYRQRQAADVAAARGRSEKRMRAPAPTLSPAEPAQVRHVTAEVPKPIVAKNNEDTHAMEMHAREQQLRDLLARFQDLVSPDSFTAMRAGFAQALVGEAMQLAPDDARVRALPSRLADAYLKAASMKMKDRDYETAEMLIRQGLELQPDHRQLRELRENLAGKKNAPQQTFGSF